MNARESDILAENVPQDWDMKIKTRQEIKTLVDVRGVRTRLVRSLHTGLNGKALRKTAIRETSKVWVKAALHLHAPENAVNRPTASILLEQDNPTVTEEIEGVRRDLILDTGSNI